MLALMASLPAATADVPPGTFPARSTRVFVAPPGEALAAAASAATGVTAAAEAEAVGGFLAAADAALGGVRLRTVRRVPTATVTHLVQQQVGPGGIPVVPGTVKSAVGASGELLHVVGDLAPTAAVAAAGAEAVAAAAASADGGAEDASARGARAAALAHLGYTEETAWRRPVQTEPVLIRHGEGGALVKPGYRVRTWAKLDNQLHDTYVGADGQVAWTACHTRSDKYRVFRRSPLSGPQVMLAGPRPRANAGGSTASMAGWLDASKPQNTQLILGNNVAAYLDLQDIDEPNGQGGKDVTTGVFNAVAAPWSRHPDTVRNRNAAVQNLFYVVNRAHDILWAAGFTEAAGNFQNDNGRRGGAAGDAVQAQAQDGGGTDNANMATPPTDGDAPVMQMYLWSIDPLATVRVGGARYEASPALFGPTVTTAGMTAPLKRMAPSRGCTPAAAGSLAGKVAIIDRGDCTFKTKALNAQAAGAVAAVVVNYPDSPNLKMADDPTLLDNVTIPMVMVTSSNGTALKAAVPQNATVCGLRDSGFIDGSLDADIILHEYAHGLTVRLAGFEQWLPLAGAFAEGASDVFAFLVSGDDRIATFANSAFVLPNSTANVGIRRWRYKDYPLTYGNITGSEVHADGEIYAAAMWRVREYYVSAGLNVAAEAPDSLLYDWVGGLFYTPADPTFEQVRDGMLRHVQSKYKDLQRYCLIYQGFADYGIGAGAAGLDLIDGRNSSMVYIYVTESFDVPVECQSARGTAAAAAAAGSRAGNAPPPNPFAWGERKRTVVSE